METKQFQPTILKTLYPGLNACTITNYDSEHFKGLCSIALQDSSIRPGLALSILSDSYCVDTLQIFHPLIFFGISFSCHVLPQAPISKDKKYPQESLGKHAMTMFNKFKKLRKVAVKFTDISSIQLPNVTSLELRMDVSKCSSDELVQILKVCSIFH